MRCQSLVCLSQVMFGDRYVMELLQQKGWSIGGENSGHILNLNIQSSTGDGIVAALQVLQCFVRMMDLRLSKWV